MNEAHWHLVLNHLPIIIPMIGLLIMLSGLIVKSEILKRAAYGIFILGALTAIAASNSGEGAEEIVEKISGIDERLIEVHEEAAETFAILLYVLAGISLIGFWANWTKKSYSNAIAAGAIVMSLVGLFFAQQTGTTGGEIRHTEIRADGVNNSSESFQNMEQDDD